MKLLNFVLPLAIELTETNVMVIIGAILLIGAVAGGKIVYTFARILLPFSLLGGLTKGSSKEESGGKGSGGGSISSLIFLGLLIYFFSTIWEVPGDYQDQARIASYGDHESNKREPLIRIKKSSPNEGRNSYQSEGREQMVNEDVRTSRKERRVPRAVKPPQEDQEGSMLINVKPSRNLILPGREHITEEINKHTVHQAMAQTEFYPTEREVVQGPESKYGYTVQMACGNIPAFVNEEAERLQRMYPRQKVQLYEDPDRDCIKIFLGEIQDLNRAKTLKETLEKHFDETYFLINLSEIDDRFLYDNS